MLRQDQMQIAKLVPQISMLERMLVGKVDLLPPGNSKKHGQVSGARFMKAGEKPVN